jgi:UDP-N-acetyl-2-amino-2-deoxyglucuronate dehydrogenase
MDNQIKFAVVGCGSIGKRHLAVIDAEPMAELVGICDINEDTCKTLSAQYDNVPYYTSLSEMLDKCEMDIVNIATPHGLHAKMAMDVARHKKHALVEKPMALHSEDCREMIKVADENNVKLFVVKQNRYNIPISLTKTAIDSGRLGKIFMVQCNVMWNRMQEYYTLSDWRGKKEMEGGALQTQVSHFLDLLIWWLGDLVEAKTIMDTLNHNIEIEDCGVSALRFSSGTIGSLFWTTCVYNNNYEGSITIIAEKGTIKIGGKYLNKIEFWDVQSYPLPSDIEFEDKPNSYGKYQGTSSNHDKLIHSLVEQFTENRKGVVEGEEAIKTIEAIEKIYNK